MKPILRKIDTGYNSSFSIKEDIYPYLYNHWHYHPEVELAYIRKGKGLRLVGNSMEEFEDGNLILLGSALPHVWRSEDIYFKGIPGLHIEAIAIHFNEEFWGSEFLRLPELQSVRKLLQESKRGLRITGKTNRIIIRKMEDVLKATDAIRISLLLEMLQIIAVSKDYSFLSTAGYAKEYDVADMDRINLVYAYTFNNFQKHISIKKVAAAVNISPHSFCRYFKTRTMKSYWQFLLEVRLGYACKLLIENKKSIANICYDCGFNNLSNFNRHFKDFLKMTPKQYMKIYEAEKVMK